jgi:hypothetical protein
MYGNVHGTIWLDSAGQKIREIQTGAGVTTELSNNYGKMVRTLDQGGGWHVEYISPNQIIYKWPATGMIIIVPGQGKIFGGIGLTIELDTFDPATGWTYTIIKEVGKITYDSASFSKLCAYLAP